MIKSVYIHIPFCKSICSYCDFCKMIYNDEYVTKYLDALYKETKKYNNDILKTVYIGGGTPSCLNTKQLQKLFNITSIFNLEDNYEFTMEFNIEDIDEGKLILATKNRVNRISIGIETINEKFYSLINRHNYKKDIIEKIKLCKKYFKNINIDLMYAFPNETIEDLQNDLKFVLDLDVQHISIYSLILEKNTKLYIYKTKPISTELESDMYYYLINLLKKNGYNHYEISNFCKNGYESIHNLNYWNNNEYYGFGLGASGYIDKVRYTNTRSINNYINGKFVFEKEKISKKIQMEEELICGLRKIRGVNKKTFKEKYNIELESVFDIKKLVKDGLIKEENEYIFIPKEKLYISNSIIVNFIL